MRSKPQVSDHWRADFRCEASQCGYRCGNEIAKLIDFIRDEYRVKYGVEYRLRKIGKNQFLAVPGDQSDLGVSYAVEAAQKFNTSVTCESRKVDQGKLKNHTQRPEWQGVQMKDEENNLMFQERLLAENKRLQNVLEEDRDRFIRVQDAEVCLAESPDLESMVCSFGSYPASMRKEALRKIASFCVGFVEEKLKDGV
jgi:hypothetical protein